MNKDLFEAVMYGDPFFNVILKELGLMDIFFLKNTCRFYKERIPQQLAQNIIIKYRQRALATINQYGT